jgi:NADH:ubiquinone oxidoreductase subunit 6 (subunit J)
MSGTIDDYITRYVQNRAFIGVWADLLAIFLVGYITMVFGIEMAWRSVGSERFAPRGKWNTTICIAVVSFLLLLTWMPTIAWPMYNRCFGSLIWFPMRYDLLTLVILSILVFSCLLLAATISIQLMRTPNMDHNERISASRMTYYLLVVALIYVSLHHTFIAQSN